jgi:hypothetical protein
VPTTAVPMTARRDGSPDSGRRSGSAPAGRARPARRRRWGQQGAVPGAFGKFALFAEVMLTGIYVAVFSIPVVTALPALTAGVRHLRRFVAGEADSVSMIWADVRAACAGVWLVALGSLAGLFLVVLNLWASSTGALPGGWLVGLVSAAFGVALLVGLLRAAGEWEPGARWTTLVASGVRGITADAAGSALLLSGVLMAGVLVWMLKPLALVVGGLVALAVMSVGHRERAARERRAREG